MHRLRPSSPRELARMFDVLAEAVTVTEADGQLVFANEAALRRMGIATLEEARAAGPAGILGRFDITDEEGKPLEPEQLPGRKLLQGEPAEPLLLRLVDKQSGRLLWTLVKASEFENEQGRRLAVNVLEDLTETKERERRARFLSHASEVLNSSLDYEETLRRVAELAVPGLADWCSVDVLEHGKIRQLAVAHADPEMIAYARQLRTRFPPSMDDPTGVGAVLRSGRRQFHPTVSEELLAATVHDEERLRIARELQLRSVMIVPMCSRQRKVLGAITFVASVAVGAYDQAAVAFAEEFATLAATAIENARLYRERNETAETLQRSLLPARLPSIPGWRLATLYQPAGSGTVIGGDFFDVFQTDGGFTVVIGDVTGKGIEAAALTALARHSLRASALLGLSPASSLTLLNRLLLDETELSLATVAVARVTCSSAGVVMTLACAGHPLPLRHRDTARPEELGEVGMLLGFRAADSWREQEVHLEPGDSVLFYTDGVTDTPGRDGRLGEQGLQHMLSNASREPEDLVGALRLALEEFRVGDAPDDVAILAAQLVSDRARSEQETVPSVSVALS